MSKPRFMLICAILAWAFNVHAENAAAPDAASAAASEPRTLKERLGDKASDEQRVDNCKVPVDQRGPKARPDTCAR